jgi:D-alanine-D-alanine ligase
MGVGELTRVAVLMGGVSSEHDVSICTGLNVLRALDPEHFTGVPVYLQRGGTWSFGFRPPEPSLALESGAVPGPLREDAGVAQLDGPGVLERLRARTDVDVVFIALHGPGGEDGTVQGLCEVAGIPYTGSGVLASALAMDKALSKRLLVDEGVPMARDVVVDAGTTAKALRDAAAQIGYPCVVKPVAGGSSFATTVVACEEDLSAAVEASVRGAGRTMIEAFLAGTEVTCGVLGGGHEPVQALPLTEIAPVADGFFDFRAKYTVGACSEITPARVDDETAQRVQELARLAHVALGCEGCSRSDFIITTSGPVMLELNTIPGMTETSLLPQGAAAAGIDFRGLVSRLVRAALARNQS